MGWRKYWYLVQSTAIILMPFLRNTIFTGILGFERLTKVAKVHTQKECARKTLQILIDKESC